MCCCDDNQTLGRMSPPAELCGDGQSCNEPYYTTQGHVNYPPAPLANNPVATLPGVINYPATVTPTTAPAAAVITQIGDPIDSTTILIVIGILGAVFFATR